MRLTHLEIKGFKSLYDVSIEMRPLMVLIGPNGSGKTSFLDVSLILSSAASGNLNSTFGLLGGFANFLTRGEADALKIQVYASIPPDLVAKYDILISEHGLGYGIGLERLYVYNEAEGIAKSSLTIGRTRDSEIYGAYGGNWHAELTIPQNEYESALSRIPYQAIEARQFADGLRNTPRLVPVDCSRRSAIRLPQDISPGYNPYSTGERLFSSLYNLRTEYDSAYEAILDILRLAFPDFRKLEFPIVASGKVSLYWYDKSSPRPFDQNELSEGTLRFLWLLTVLLSPQKPPIILIDEPEVSLHPQLLMLLADVLKEASKDSQIIVATHSDKLIRWLDPENVAVVEKENGKSSIKWLDAENLKGWLENYTLDQLWLDGHIGGKV